MADLSRFLEAQENTYPVALQELQNGRKQSHWMWYIFPQIKGLGNSQMSQYYAISNLQEAKAYLQHPVLGKRLVDLCNVLLSLDNLSAVEVFGPTDSLKLRSCMTLFHFASNDDEPVFEKVLNHYFGGKKDHETTRILEDLNPDV